jgi:hypothetical protein
MSKACAERNDLSCSFLYSLTGLLPVTPLTGLVSTTPLTLPSPRKRVERECLLGNSTANVEEPKT